MKIFKRRGASQKFLKIIFLKKNSPIDKFEIYIKLFGDNALLTCCIPSFKSPFTAISIHQGKKGGSIILQMSHLWNIFFILSHFVVDHIHIFVRDIQYSQFLLDDILNKIKLKAILWLAFNSLSYLFGWFFRKYLYFRYFPIGTSYFILFFQIVPSIWKILQLCFKILFIYYSVLVIIIKIL